MKSLRVPNWGEYHRKLPRSNSRHYPGISPVKFDKMNKETSVSITGLHSESWTRNLKSARRKHQPLKC